MQQESKIGFLWQYVIACVHPSQYKELIRKKKGAFIGYISVLIMFLVFIEKHEDRCRLKMINIRQ